MLRVDTPMQDITSSLTNTVHSRQSVVTWSYSLMVRERAPVGDSLPLKLRLVPVYTTTHANNNVRRGVDHGVEGVLTPWKYVGGVRVCFDPRKNVIFLHSKLLLDNSVVSHHQGWKTCVKHMEGKKTEFFEAPETVWWSELTILTTHILRHMYAIDNASAVCWEITKTSS